MTGRGKDKWHDLPDVVAQLQAEAKNPAISRPRIDWPDDPSQSGVARPTVHGHREHDRRPQTGGVPAVPPPVPARRDPSAERAPSSESPATDQRDQRDQIEWGGLPDYDRLAQDPRPDLRALGRLLEEACQRACGTRFKAIQRLLDDANSRIDKILTLRDAASVRVQREALRKLLDRIEDLLASALTVNP